MSFSRFSELSQKEVGFISMCDLEGWVSCRVGEHPWSFIDIRIGSYAIVTIDKYTDDVCWSTIEPTLNNFVIKIYTDRLDGIPLKWLYEDWQKFCLEMARLGFSIDKDLFSGLDFKLALNGKEIYNGFRVL